MVHTIWLKDVVVFLAAAGILVPLLHRARLGAVLGFLVVGVLVGPYGLGAFADALPWLRHLTIDEPKRVEPLAEVGVVFLLFLLGLELSITRLWELRRYVLGLGAAQVGATALVSAGVVFLLGLGGRAALVLGLCLALSSTAVVMQLLKEQHRSASVVGRVALSVLLFQDVMLVPILFITGMFGGPEQNIALGLGRALLQATAVTVLIVLAGRYVLRPLLRFTGRTGNRELIMAISLLIIVGVAGLTEAAGFSAALGAFLAGAMLGETEYRHQIEVDLDPFKGLLLGLFFMTVGMSIDVGHMIGSFAFIGAALVVLIAGKAMLLFALARAFGLAAAAAAEVALLLSQAGEFTFVVLAIAEGTIVTRETVQFVTVVVALSMMLTPALAVLAQRTGDSLKRRAHAAHEPKDELGALADHVVIGGFGRVGQTIARVLESENIPLVALDADAQVVTQQRKAGRALFFGDASRGDLLDRVGAGRARAVVVTLDDPVLADRMVQTVLSRWPRALVLARAKDPGHAARLSKLGAVGVIPEAVEASVQLAGRVLEAVGLPDELVLARLSEARAEECAKLETPTT